MTLARVHQLVVEVVWRNTTYVKVRNRDMGHLSKYIIRSNTCVISQHICSYVTSCSLFFLLEQ